MLEERKLLMKEGTLVEATIIAAPSSTKNARKERDPEMHQSGKGNPWYFGMKAHIGVEAKSGLVPRVSGTAANVADIAQTPALLHGGEKEVYAEAGYLGVEKREEITTRSAGVEWHVAAQRGKVKAMAEGLVKEVTLLLEQAKARVRARVEHPLPAPSGAALRAACGRLSRSARLHVIKNLFKHRKVRYRGRSKNTAHLYSRFARANLVVARRALLNTANA